MSYRDDEGHGTDTANDSTKVVAGRSKRKLVDARYHPASNHLSLDFRYTKRARYQHISNLVTCMRHFEATGEDDKLALVLATMLLAEVCE